MRILPRVVLLFLLLPAVLKVQLLYAQAGKQFYFTHYTTESGLLSTEINSVLQDAEGYIWTGSSDGLQRFDGTRFKTFRHISSDSTSIPSNIILQLLLDSHQNLWILTAEGRVGIFNTRNFRFHEAAVIISKPAALKTAIKRLIRDEDGNIFLLLGGQELVTWNEKKNAFSFEYNFFTLPPGLGVADFIQQPGTPNYWISIQNGGIAIYNHENRKLFLPGKNTVTHPIDDRLTAVTGAYNIYFDKKGRCWYQVWGPGFPEIYSFDLANKKAAVSHFEFITTLRTYYETYPFFEQKDSTLWITGMGVLARFMENENKFQFVYNGYRNERSISYERVTSLAEDREKNIWVSTSNNGIYRFNPSEQYFTNIPHMYRNTGNPGHGSVMSFVPTRWGTILAGTWGDGLYQYDKNFNLLPTDIKGIDNKLGPSGWCMIASGDSNTIWLSSQPGLYAIDQAKRSATLYNPAALDNRTIRQVAEDKQGTLWLGLNNYGVFTWDEKEKKAGNAEAIKRFDKIPVVMINKIIIDHLGYAWIGTGGNGVYVVDTRTGNLVEHFTNEGGNGFILPDAGISSLLDYDDSTMIITTSRHVILYNRYLKTARLIGKPDFMQGFISSAEKDKKGYLWVSTTNGLYRVNTRKKIFIRFNREDGIENDRFTFAASRVLPDGRMFFGNSEQFIAFDPAVINVRTTASPATITDFKVMNKTLLVDSLMRLKQTVLRYTNNSLEIEFSPLVYNTGLAIMYKLEGLDPDWRMADKNNRAIYSYVPPGKYTFLIKTMDSEGQISDIITSMKIRITPPFWKSWWFFSLLALATGALLFRFDRERMKRKEAIQKMRSTIADNLHGEVNTALNNINILSEMARLKADKDPGKSKEYIEQIHTKSHNMIIAMDDMLWSLDPGNDSMSRTTDRMREYIDALNNRYGVSIDIAVDKKVETLELNMKLRHEAFLVFKEGIKNLVLVGANNCHVYIRLDKGHLYFTTLFDSDKCDLLQLNNLLHRQDLERRLNGLNASIDIDLHRNHSAISLRVPVA